MATVVRAAALCACVVTASSCAREIVGQVPPLDNPHFPTGLAVHPMLPRLAVVSSNFDLKFSRGALLFADLDEVDEAVAAADDGFVALGRTSTPYVTAGLIPSFGNVPVFVDDGQSALLATRDENIIAEIPLVVDGEELEVDCEVPAGSTVPAPVCGEAPSAVQVQGNDPFQIAVYSESAELVDFVVGLLATPEVFYFRFRPAVTDLGRLTLLELATVSLEGYSALGEAIGVHSVVIRPAMQGAPPTAFLTVERTDLGTGTNATDLVWFDASRAANAALRVFGLTGETGSIAARDIALHPDGTSLFVLLRTPDAIARIDLVTSGGGVSAVLGGLVSSCYDPIDAEVAVFETPGGAREERLLVTCFDNDSLLAYDPRSLVEVEAVRRFGDGPYDIALDVAHDPPRAYVSYFLDDTVGAFDLVDDEGEARLVPRARIGEPRLEGGL